MEEDESTEFFDFVTSGVCVTVFASAGLIGNGISLLVLSTRRMRSSISCLLQGLAVYDSVLLICGLLIFGLPSLSAEASGLDYYLEQLYADASLVLYPLAYMAHVGSTWTTVCVTIERYVAVCHPLKARSFCTYGRARLCNVILFIFSVCYNLPRFWEAQVTEEFDDKKNITYLATVDTELRQNEVYSKVYYTWLYIVMRFLVPLLLLSVLNGIIIKTIRDINKSRQTLGENLRKEVNLALMLVSVVAVFFFCNVFALTVKLMDYNYYLVDLSNTLIVFNSSVNFIIYCIFGKKFRQVLMNMVCKPSVQTLMQKTRIWSTTINSRLSLTDISTVSMNADGESEQRNPSETTITKV